jgi:hypothetical protein
MDACSSAARRKIGHIEGTPGPWPATTTENHETRVMVVALEKFRIYESPL